MKIQAVFFDMGGTIEPFESRRENRLEATRRIGQKLEQAGIDLCLTNEQLCDVISSGLDRYKRWCLQSLEELPPARVWSEYILSGRDVDQDILPGISEELMFLIETGFYRRVMRPEMPEVLRSIKRWDSKLA